MFKKFINWFKKLAHYGDFRTPEALAEYYYRDPDGLSDWLQRNIEYLREPEGKNVWQTSLQTLGLRTGDCEDYATLTHDVLKAWGWESVIFCMYPKKGNGHVICIFVQDGIWKYFDNKYLKQFQTRLYDNIMREYNSKYVRYKIV